MDNTMDVHTSFKKISHNNEKMRGGRRKKLILQMDGTFLSSSVSGCTQLQYIQINFIN